MSFFMPVNYVKEYLIFVYTGVVYLQLFARLLTADTIPILRIDV